MNLERSSQYNANTVFGIFEISQSSSSIWILAGLDCIFQCYKKWKKTNKSSINFDYSKASHSKLRYKRALWRPVATETKVRLDHKLKCISFISIAGPDRFIIIQINQFAVKKSSYPRINWFLLGEAYSIIHHSIKI